MPDALPGCSSMPRRRNRKAVDRSRFRKYAEVAEHFFEAGKASMGLEYWTAAGVLFVHSAIAYADALCILQAGVRSAGDDHEDAVALIEELIAGGDERTGAVNQLRRIVEIKTRVSYLGELFSQADARALERKLERFRSWAKSLLER